MLGGAANTGGSSPLHTEVLAQLCESPFSFQDKAFRFNTACFGGDRYLCIKDSCNAGDKDKASQVGIVDIVEDFEVDRRISRKAEGAMKNPHENILALRGLLEDGEGHFIQVFDLDTKARLGDHTFAEEIVFWRWLPQRCLVIVTRTGVYHWFLRGDGGSDALGGTGAASEEPILMFTRTEKMADTNVQIINYTVDNETSPADVQWCLLAGIYLGERKTIMGCLQLYSVQKQMQQFLEGHSGCFGSINLDDPEAEPLKVLSFCERKGGVNKLFVMDIYSPRGEGRPTPFKVTAEFSYPPDQHNDLPIAQHLSSRHGVIYVATKAGYTMLFDAKTGRQIVCERVSHDSVFLCCANRRSGGILLVNRKGALISVTVNENTLISHVQATLGVDIALSLAQRYCYPVADDYTIKLFRTLVQQNKWTAAVRIAALSKGNALRNSNVFNQIKNAPPMVGSGQMSVIVQYFNYLLELGIKLNGYESLELMRPVVAQHRPELVGKWLDDDALECSESLGDLCRSLDDSMAIRIYSRANCHSKVIQYYVEKSMFQEILSYVKKKKYSADFSFLLRSMLTIDPMGAVNFARSLLGNDPTPLMDINSAIDVFVGAGKVAEITGILVDTLKSDKPEHANLQTRLFEINLMPSTAGGGGHNNYSGAELLFQSEQFTHYDRLRVAQLCEKAGLYRRALEHYSDINDIKRVMIRCGTQMNLEWLMGFCEKLLSMTPPPPTSSSPTPTTSETTVIEILSDMLRQNRGNLQSVVQVCIKFHHRLGIPNLINLFETVNSTEGLYYFLGSIMAFSNDPDVHFKYIEAAMKLENYSEVERVVRESVYYDPIRVMEFLRTCRAVVEEPRPLIYVYDKHGYINELTEFLYRNNLMNYLEIYVTKVNSRAAGTIIVTLLDLGCNESTVIDLLDKVRGACPLEPLIPEMENRGRLQLILSWMEQRIEEGLTDAVLNNAVAKVYIDTNRDPEKFLTTNLNYDPRTIGEYCENKDPHLAVIAYMRGQCDTELINVTNKNGLFRIQAKYLIQRKSPQVWAQVLQLDDSDGGDGDANSVVAVKKEYRRQLVDQITATALNEASGVDEISCVVKAFVDAKLEPELLELLERIVLQKIGGGGGSGSSGGGIDGESLSNSPTFQNLLLLTAMSAKPSKVKDYINRLDAFDPLQVAAVATSDEFRLYEEALLVYKKFNMNDKALDILLYKMGDFKQAETYAEKAKDPNVWQSLALAELNKAEEILASTSTAGSGAATTTAAAGEWVVRAMVFYAKAEKCAEYKRVIQCAKQAQQFTELAEFLRKLRAQRVGSMGDVDSELAYCLARTSQWSSLETFLCGAHTANTQMIGDRLFEEGLQAESDCEAERASNSYRAAKVFYAKVPNHTKLTLCLIKLGEYNAAYESAKRAGSAKSWTEVALASVANGQLKIAHSAGLNIINNSDHLERLINAYEAGGYSEQLLEFLEAGVATGKGNIGLYTEMGIVYAKYRPEQLLDFLKSAPVVTAGRLNVPKLIKVCEAEKLWKAEVLLYLSYNEYDQAATVILNHSSVAWEHDQFLSILQKVTNVDILYKALVMYLEEHPTMLSQLLTALSGRGQIDHARVIMTIKAHQSFLDASRINLSPLALISSWLEEEQTRANEHTSIVNDTLHDLYLDRKDVEKLRKSINSHDNFDQTELAAKLEKHELIEMKQLALSLYEKNGKYNHAIELAKKFHQYEQAMAIARTSNDSVIAEGLLRYFVDELKSAQHFAACLQVCNALIRPEVALELAWLAGYQDELMPFMIQSVGSLRSRLDKLEKEVAKQSQSQSERKDKQSANELVSGLMSIGMAPMLPNTPASFSPFAANIAL